MAETIGRAYIRILADGTGFDESVRRQMHDSEEVFEEGAQEHSDIYNDAYAARDAKNKKIEQAFDKKMDKLFGHLKADAEFMGGDFGERLARSMSDGIRQEFPDLEHAADDLGERIGNAILHDFTRTGQFSVEFRQRLHAAMAEVAKEQKDAFAAMHTDALADNRAFNRKWAKQNEDNDREYSLHIARLRDAAMTLTEQHEEALRDNAEFNRRWAEQNEENDVNYSIHIGKITRATKDAERAFREYERQKQKSSDVGRFFGKGSRNDLINFFGSFIGGVAGLAEKAMLLAFDLPKATKAIRGFFTVGASGASGASEAFAAFSAALPAILAAVAAIALAIPIVISALSLLAGAIIAVADSLAFALIGAAAPIVGLLAPIALMAGATAAAFIGMDKATKKLVKESLAPLKDLLKDIGKAARPGVLKGLTEGVENLRDPKTRASLHLFDRLTTMFESAGDAVGNFIERFTQGIRGGGLGRFITMMTTELPGIGRRLGIILGNAFGGVLGIFANLAQPGGPVDRFLNWLTDLSRDFDAWSGSVEGQTQMTDFFNEASESAEGLWGVITGIWDTLTGLSQAGGKEAGDSIIKGLGKGIRELVDYIQAHPEEVKEWFKDAEKFAKALGRAAKAAAKLFDDLDTPQTRRIVTGLVEFFEFNMQAIALAVKLAKTAVKIQWGGIGLAIQYTVNNIILPVLANFVHGVALIMEAWADMLHALAGVPGFGWVDGIADDMHNAAVKTDELSEAIRAIPDKTVNVFVNVHTKRLPAGAGETRVPGPQGDLTAAGGIFSGAQARIIGEAGAEAVVPLHRPLSQVDPAVRELSAIAQGLKPMARGGVLGRTVDASGWTIVSPNDPKAVAHEVLNRLVAASY